MMDDYHDSFDTKAYLNFYKNHPDEPEVGLDFRLKELHKFWSTFEHISSSNDTTLLDYGCGPVVTNVASAAPKVHHIVLAEYTEKNRIAVSSWINGDPDVHDWSPMIEYIVKDIEGDQSNEAPSFRMQEIKRKIKSVVPCDITKKPIVELHSTDVDKLFDVVSTTLCLEVCTSTVQEYKAAIAELCKLLKPGGYLYMAGALGCTYYRFGGAKFSVLPLEREIIEETLKNEGIVDVKFEAKPFKPGRVISDTKAMFIVYGHLKLNN